MDDVVNPADPKVLLMTPWDWHLARTAKAFAKRGALAGFWSSTRDRVGLPTGTYRRCWPFHVCMTPFYRYGPPNWIEPTLYAMTPIWRFWLSRQSLPSFNVVQSIMGFCTEAFDYADKVGGLKVLDSPTAHPVLFSGFWQREYDLWCPKQKIPIPRWMFARMNREVERADLVLCPSEFVFESMLINGIPENKCFINPFGVDTNIFQPRVELPEKPRFVSVGTIRLLKGHHYLLRAFELVRQQIPDAELVLVGQFYRDFTTEAKRWKGSFTHIERLPHPELAKLLRTCTAFVIPSAQEGLARVIPEAMAAGLPIIASYESGATTLVKDGVEGFIVNGRQPRHIADAMVRVASSPQLTKTMGEAAHKRGAISNTWQDYGDRLIREYESRLLARAKHK